MRLVTRDERYHSMLSVRGPASWPRKSSQWKLLLWIIMSWSEDSTRGETLPVIFFKFCFPLDLSPPTILDT